MTSALADAARRQAKRDSMRDRGFDSFRGITAGSRTLISSLLGESGQGATGARELRLAGRIVKRRKMRSGTLLGLRDRSGDLQVYVPAVSTVDRIEELLECDIGDIVAVCGYACAHRGHPSFEVISGNLLSKALRINYGLVERGLISTRRELELMASSNCRERLKARAAFISALREFMDRQGFLEVETPMLQTLAGGALARPFLTHHNALGRQVSLRISAQLYLRRCTIGDLERVYDLGKRFRNEGISLQHSPEFTMLEWMMSYSDYRDAAELAENAIVFAAERALGGLVFHRGDHIVDLTPPWPRVTVQEAIKARTGLDILSGDRESLRAGLPGRELSGAPWPEVVQLLYQEYVEPSLIAPTIVFDFPLDTHPCVAAHDDNPELGRNFDLLIGGVELASGGTDVTDPDTQAFRFAQQGLGRKEASSSDVHPNDLEYVEALQYGAPPASGAGIGIDRLLMVLLDQRGIQDTTAFPIR